ncbi:MAG: hypothetical protein U0637_07205 [Phycisphaerales bacterium]
MLARDCILISLSPTSLRVALTAGTEVTRTERVDIDTVNFEEAWQQGLRPLDDALRSALRSLDARNGALAQVVYHSPRMMSEIFVAPATGPAALQAARLHLTQSLPDAGQGWATNIQPLQQITEATRTKRQVMLLSTDTEVNQNTVAQWLVRCGVKPATIAPSKSMLLEHAVRASPESGSTTVRIYFDEHAMTLCGWIDGRLAFARCADVGYGLVIDALKRAARMPNGDLPSREYASRLLFSTGMPTRGQILDVSRNLSADAVMPLMQPALQRCIIEVRQTLRFGLPEQDIQRATIHLDGPGSVIPGISKAFFDHLEVDLTCRERDAGPNSGVAEDQVGDLAIAAQHRASELWSVPPCERIRAENKRLTLCIRAGAAVGILLLAAMWGSTRRASAAAQHELEALAPQAAKLEHVIALRAKMSADASTIEGACALIDAGLGRHTSWLSALALPVQEQGSDVTILGVDGVSPKDGNAPPILTVHGRVPPAEVDSHAGADHVTELVERLTASPVVLSARVVSARTDGAGTEFVIEAALRSTPASLPFAEGESRTTENKKP